MGYLYAMSNKSMPGILKIGMTERSIEERLKEANGTFTLIPFVVEISKYVSNFKEKERCIHQILQSKRVNPKKEFFQVTLEEIKPIFDLMDSVEKKNIKEIIQDKKYEETDNFDILFGIYKIHYGMFYIDIDHNKKLYTFNNQSYSNLKFAIDYIDSQIPYIDIINKIIDNNIIKTNKTTTITLLEMCRSFKKAFEKIIKNYPYPHKLLNHVLYTKYPLQLDDGKLTGFDIIEPESYEIKNLTENYLDKCYINISCERITLNDYYNSFKERDI
jgi:hypothetical protein